MLMLTKKTISIIIIKYQKEKGRFRTKKGSIKKRGQLNQNRKVWYYLRKKVYRPIKNRYTSINPLTGFFD